MLTAGAKQRRWLRDTSRTWCSLDLDTGCETVECARALRAMLPTIKIIALCGVRDRDVTAADYASVLDEVVLTTQPLAAQVSPSKRCCHFTGRRCGITTRNHSHPDVKEDRADTPTSVQFRLMQPNSSPRVSPCPGATR